jgi:hypothetical protein
LSVLQQSISATMGKLTAPDVAADRGITRSSPPSGSASIVMVVRCADCRSASAQASGPRPETSSPAPLLPPPGVQARGQRGTSIALLREEQEPIRGPRRTVACASKRKLVPGTRFRGSSDWDPPRAVRADQTASALTSTGLARANTSGRIPYSDHVFFRSIFACNAVGALTTLHRQARRLVAEPHRCRTSPSRRISACAYVGRDAKRTGRQTQSSRSPTARLVPCLDARISCNFGRVLAPALVLQNDQTSRSMRMAASKNCSNAASRRS